MSWLSKMFGKKQELSADERAELESLRVLHKEQSEARRLQAEQEELREIRKKQRQTEKELCTARGEPFIEIVNEEYDEEKGIRLEFDWNDIFINELRKNWPDSEGVSDEVIVQAWMSLVMQDKLSRTMEGQLDMNGIESDINATNKETKDEVAGS